MSEAEQAPAAEEGKRPFQFGLRSMFVVTFVWAVLCAMAFTFGLLPVAYGCVVVCSGCATVYALYRKRYNWAGLLVFTFFLFSCIMPGIQGASSSNGRHRCMNNLKQIGLALTVYHDRHGRFPPAYVADESGKPMHSWRVLLLPFLEEKGLYDAYNFDEPWDGPNNSKLHEYIASCYRCPTETRDESAANATDTSYVVVVGPGTMFPGEAPVVMRDIRDGLSRTIMVVEIADSGIHWMEPRDLHVVQMAPDINAKAGQGVSSRHGTGAIVLFADGHVEYIDRQSHTPQQVQALLGRADGE